MKRYIALFRGINVGGNRILTMNELKELLRDLGLSSIRTYIQSGNAVFDAPGEPVEIAEKIRARIRRQKGWEPAVLLLDSSRFSAALDRNPFPTDSGKALHLFFLESVPEKPDLEKLQALKTPTEQFRLHDKMFYLYAPEGVGRSRLAARVESCLGTPATARNWNTVLKLQALADEASS